MGAPGTGARTAGPLISDLAEPDHFLAREFAAAQRGRAVTLVMFGFARLDEFSTLHGYEATDTALREFGDLLRRMTRKMNLTARYGWRGDMFLSVLSDAGPTAAEGYVSRVRASTEAMGRTLPELQVGIAVYDPRMRTPDEFVEAAEQALAAVRAAAYNAPVPVTRAG